MSDTANNDVNATVNALDEQLAHLWMVRTFLKNSDEAVDDEEVSDIARELYDFIVSLAPAKKADDDDAFLKMAKKRFPKLKTTAELFVDIQPDISTHTNFEMAAKSLTLVVDKISSLLAN